MTIEQINALKKRTATLSIVSNTILVLLKLLVGIFAGAVSLISEAMHSGVDLMAALIAFWAVRESVKPPDEEHDYGHGKFENLSSAIEVILIVCTAVFIIYEAFHKFSNSVDPEFLKYGIYIMIISIAINLLVSHRLMKVGRATDSQALVADGLHLRSDVWTSVGVLLGLMGMEFFGWYWLDPVVAVVVGAIIFHAGYKMVVESARELTDASLSVREEQAIGEIIVNHRGLRGYHHLRTRKSGSYKIIDVHVNFPPEMTLLEVHNICDEVENDLRKHFGEIDVTIHPEPVDDYGMVVRN